MLGLWGDHYIVHMHISLMIVICPEVLLLLFVVMVILSCVASHTNFWPFLMPCHKKMVPPSVCEHSVGTQRRINAV